MLLTMAQASLVLAAVPFGMFLINLRHFRTAPQPPPRGSRPRLSILVPARNEEGSIEACVRAALAVRDADVEVIVLDDHSTDRTADIVRSLAAAEPRLRLESAPALPPGWCGKQHACHVLSKLTTREWLAFIDADVRLRPDALARAVAFADVSGAGLVSGFPRQETGTALERLLIPLIHFILLGFLPWMHASTRPAFSAGCGQFFLARRRAYENAGGHAAIRASLHDGVTLPRAFRRAGHRTDLFDATDAATCRMYRSAAQVWHGLAKNATEGMAAPKAIVLWTLLLGTGQVVPAILVTVSAIAARPDVLMISGAAACIGVAARLLAAWRFRQSLLGALLHPAGVAVLLCIQWYALARHLAGRAPNWRGRSYARTAEPTA